jgi:hypothetical protein
VFAKQGGFIADFREPMGSGRQGLQRSATIARYEDVFFERVLGPELVFQDG